MITKQKTRFFWVTIILGALGVGTILVSLTMGSLGLTPLEVLKTLIGQGNKSENIAIFQLRLPRILVGILVGVALAISGCVLQGVTRNDLADSGILGINAGSALFVVVYLYLLNGNVYEGMSNFTIFTMPVIALLGALFGAFLIYTLAWKKGISSSRLLLIGIGVNVAFTSILTIFQMKFTTQEFNRVVAWTTGSIWGSSWAYVLAILPFILVFMVMVWRKHSILNIMHLGEEVGVGLGLEVEKERRKLIFYSVVLAGVATSVAGSISFLGLIAPHIGRKLVGPKHQLLLPVSGMLGALILLASDTVARNAIAPMELPVGIVVAVLGVPYFIYLMLGK